MSDFMKKRLIVIVGPTAVGKTKIAIQLAKIFYSEIISADSRQLYKEMTIGTAKPSAIELGEVRHHFIDQVPIENAYDAGQYGRDALDLISVIFQTNDTLIMCGGSGLYIKAVLEGFDEMPDIPDVIRQQIIEEYNAKGLDWLQRQVQENDPEYFDVVDQKNPQRLMRAMEVIRHSSLPASSFRKKEKRELPFEVVKIGLELDREVIYDRINQRVDNMFEAGLLEEARKLYPKKSLNALQTVGYQELFGYFDGDYDLEEAVRLLKRNTRRYAKRQMTWFKKDEEIKWFHPNQLDTIVNFINAK
ncbi:MAG: tRNA (adenosine(37)-N6)-dimethylallyltransferase MiaA [Cyclobacteriaceae bacterium]|nr:tRNA (adenosine(37)-N6)-dimethylallyltransferase MiaA [Cyclobacteriaceae bacterium]